MSVTNETYRVQVTLATVVQAIPIPFYFLEQDDLIVFQTVAGTDTLMVLNTNYTLAGEGVEAGGTLTTIGGTVGAVWTIARADALTQSEEFIYSGSLSASSIERAYDRLAMQIQRVFSMAKRALRFPITAAEGGELALNSRKGMLLGFDGTTGDPTFTDPLTLIPSDPSVAVGIAAAVLVETNRAIADVDAEEARAIIAEGILVPKRTPVFSDVENLTNIAMWGDSLTAAVYDNVDSISGVAVYNGGVGGETSSQIMTRFNADSTKRTHMNIIWIGRNDDWSNSSTPTSLKSRVASAIETLTSAGNSGRYLVIGVTISAVSGEYIGQLNGDRIRTYNSEMAALYGSKFLDLNTVWVNAYDSGTPQDVIDFGNGVPPSSLRSDTVHPNSAGETFLAQQIVNVWFTSFAGGNEVYLSAAFLPYYLKNASFKFASTRGSFSVGTTLTVGTSINAGTNISDAVFESLFTQAVRLSNTNGYMRILPWVDGKTYVQSSQGEFKFSGLNAVQGTAVSFDFASCEATGSLKGQFFVNGQQNLSGAGAVNIITGTTLLTTTGANALTLVNGLPGQRKTIICVSNSGTATLTPSVKTGFSTVAFTAVGQSVELEFINSLGWMVVNNYGATITP